MSDRIRIGRPEDFSRFPAVITEGSRTYFLVRQASGFALLSNVCPHQGGAVYDKGTCFECPLHGWQFDRLTGRCLNAPSRSLAVLPVAEDEDGVLYADLPRPAHIDRVPHGARPAKAGLTIALHSHACLEVSYEGFTLLTDPWLDGPAFLGAWMPSPPPDTNGADLRPDAVLITHEHSDHFHEPTLRHFDRRTPIFVPDFPNERLPRRLAALGFADVRRVRFGERTRVRRNWTLTAFEPASYWNDAFVLIDIDGFRLFDINDAGVNARIAKMVGAVDALAVQFSAGASGYPWTWAHLSDSEKAEISRKACSGKLQLIREATSIYGASAVLPFASHFALWHPSHQHYASLMTRNTLADVKATLADTDVDVIDLLPGDTWDVGRGVIRRGSSDASIAHSGDAAARFADAHPSDESLTRAELTAYLLRLNDVPEVAFCEDVVVRLQAESASTASKSIDVSFAVTNGHLAILDATSEAPNLRLTVPLGVATAVVRQELSWDEAFIGYWCRFDRRPNVYHSGFWRLFQAPYYKRPIDVRESAALPIAPTSTVAEVLETHGDRADRILRRYGLYCLGCQHSTAESLEMAARQHGLEPKRCDLLIKELNQAFHGEAVD
ncbi:MAG TPA: MBL fold metallo-hydrolase [Vicinamibacterales bacterium]|nr:MBL fold metallo-hydrolase [Vicinamibacterales bacterium]